MVLPNGVRANEASLKCCNPNGIPIMVQQRRMPQARWERQIIIPPVTIHRIFIKTLIHPLELGQLCTVLPKGSSARNPSFSVWMPKGMPMIVIMSNKLDIKYSSAIKIPPQISHKRFISSRIVVNLSGVRDSYRCRLAYKYSICFLIGLYLFWFNLFILKPIAPFFALDAFCRNGLLACSTPLEREV